MPTQYAQQFSEILAAVANDAVLRQEVLQLITSEPMPGKVLEGGNRSTSFRQVLADLVNGKLKLSQAYHTVETSLPRNTSQHDANNRVFPDGWAERLVRTQLSRCYNQAVLQRLRDAGEQSCFVPHSSEEDASSPCSVHLAGASHSVQELLANLIRAYRDGQWSNDELKIPNHPHCTHTVVPLP